MKRSFLKIVLAVSVFLSVVYPSHPMAKIHEHLNHSILVPENTDKVTFFAAQELKKYLEKMTGNHYPIVSQVPLSGKVISIGKTNLSGQKNINVPSRYSDDDQFLMREVENNLFLIGGNGRGTLYAVYSALEKLGCQWIAPNFDFYGEHSEVIPTKQAISFRGWNILEGAKFRYRIASGLRYAIIGKRKQYLPALIEWIAKQRYNYVRINPSEYDKYYLPMKNELSLRGIKIYSVGHSWDKVLPPENYFDDHPDWFALDKRGIRTPDKRYTFCVSNKEALNTFLKNAYDLYFAQPTPDVFGLWPADGDRWCTCKRCKSIGPPSDRMALVTRKVAEQIRQRHPEAIIGSAAFSAYTEVPNRQNLPENILVEFCPGRRNYSTAIYEGEGPNLYYITALSAWTKKHPEWRLILHSYYRKHIWESLPVNIVNRMAHELSWYRKNGFVGASIYLVPSDWLSYELQQYAFAKLCWNPDKSFEEILEPYCNARFGPASDLMKQYFRKLERLVLSLHAGSTASSDPYCTSSIEKDNHIKLIRPGGGRFGYSVSGQIKFPIRKIDIAQQEIGELTDVLYKAVELVEKKQNILWNIKNQNKCLERWKLRMDVLKQYIHTKDFLESNTDRGLVEPLMIRKPLKLY